MWHKQPKKTTTENQETKGKTNNSQATKQSKQSEKANVCCSGNSWSEMLVRPFRPKYRQWKQRAEIVSRTNSYL
jgi:hypothetical protein